MSSITPQTSIDLAHAAADKGIRVLDAPVSGGEAGAIEAVLSIMAGGDRADFDAARPLLEALGKTIVHCGPHGAGQTVKAANQLIVAINIQACAEAVVFLEKSGVDLTAALDVLGGGLAGSTVLARKKDNFKNRDFPPASASTSTTRTWASSPTPPAPSAPPCPSAPSSPPSSPRCAPRVTAASTTPPSSAVSNASPGTPPRTEATAARTPAPCTSAPRGPRAGSLPGDRQHVPSGFRAAAAPTLVLSRPGVAAARNTPGHLSALFQQTVDDWS